MASGFRRGSGGGGADIGVGEVCRAAVVAVGFGCIQRTECTACSGEGRRESTGRAQ